MKLLLTSLFAILVSVSATPQAIRKAANVDVKKGDVVNIESPGYPDVPPAGTNVQWSITGEPGINLLLVCEDLRISPSPQCEKGFFQVYDGENTKRICGSESYYTVKSEGNQMRLEFDVNWASGVAKCTVEGVAPDEGTVEPQPDDTPADGSQAIQLKLGGGAYDNIFYSNIPKSLNKVWNFETNPGSKIGIHCSHVNTANDCGIAMLEVIGGQKTAKICGSKSNWDLVSDSNTLKVQLITADRWNGGRVDCLVQAVSGKHPFEYRNIVSEEVDSSEHGRKEGPRKTDCRCGWTAKSPGRIVNGQEVSNGQYPWVVSLNYGGGHICGGSIITEYHILTAAHCTVKKEARNFKIYMGTTNNTHAKDGQIVQVKEILNHNYDSSKYHAKDISILLLAAKIQFTNQVGPVCLTPNKQPLDNKFITVMGWGALGKEGNWVNPEQLMRAHMRVVEYHTCSFLWYRYFNTANPDRVCTWASNRDSCFGDSGGPLVWVDPETNRYTQIGLVSFGRGCNTDFPKVNSNVAHYYDWIQETIKRTMPSAKTCKKI